MSAKVMGQVWELDLPHAHMLVLLAMADHADHQGDNVYPGVKLIAWKCGYSERQVQRIIQDLVDAGLLIEVQNEPGKAVVYRIELANGAQKKPLRVRQNVTPDKMSPVTKRQAGGDIAMSPGGVTSSTPKYHTNSAPERAKVAKAKSANRHIEPSIEPSIDSRAQSAPANSDHQALMAAYQDALGYKIPNGAKEAVAAKKILQARYTVAQAIEVYHTLKGGFWGDKHLSLHKVYEEMGAVLNAPKDYRNGPGSTQTQGSRALRNGRPANADQPSGPVSSYQAEYERDFFAKLNGDDSGS